MRAKLKREDHSNAPVLAYEAPVFVEEESKEPSESDMMQEETKEEEAWLLQIVEDGHLKVSASYGHLLESQKSKAFT